jgi:hypothetical protein
LQLVIATLFSLLLVGCGSLPFDGKVLDAISEDPEVEPVSCQCNVYCNGSPGATREQSSRGA